MDFGTTAHVERPIFSGARRPVIQSAHYNVPLEQGVEVAAAAALDAKQMAPDSRCTLHRNSSMWMRSFDGKCAAAQI
jgi:hypothetical protein